MADIRKITCNKCKAVTIKPVNWNRPDTIRCRECKSLDVQVW